MKKVSYKVALGGVVSALCLLLMFLTAVIPPLSITLPLFAGMLIFVVAIEISSSWAFVTYAAVSVLSFFVTPDKDAWLFFTLLFGYYPVAKSYFEKIKLKVLCWLCKLAVFNVSIVIIYYVTANLLGTLDLFEEFGFYNEWLIPALLVAGNLVFLLYEYALTLIIDCYRKWFRPTFLGKSK
ncbi:MAG: hypothetical protein HDT21_07700 [Ruminococcus sp.]|nr:hypothetical protein [Ruminococcus sp.]